MLVVHSLICDLLWENQPFYQNAVEGTRIIVTN